jgi:hypothetical protein
MYMMTAFALAGYGAMFVLPGQRRFELVVFGLISTIILIYVVKEMFFGSDLKVVIDQNGVLDTRLGVGVIRWKDINGIYMEQLKSIDHVCLDVLNEDRYLSKRSAVNNLGAKFLKATNRISPFNINTGLLDAGPDEIYAAIVHGCKYYAGSEPVERK